MKESKKSNIWTISSSTVLQSLLLLFFISPYFLFFKNFSPTWQIDISEVLWALKNSLVQSVGAALICVFLGIFLASGVFKLSHRWREIVLRLLLIPIILPSLFSILIAFSVVVPFPVGHIGVIIIYVLINLGFSTVHFFHTINSKAGNLPVTSEILGLSRITFFKRILLPLIKFDVLLNFVLVFLFCFSSLAVPLVAGGGKGTNIEVLIYEKIFIDQNWPVAWSLILFQSAIVFLLSYFFLKERGPVLEKPVAHRYLKSGFALIILSLYLVFYLGGYVWQLTQSVSSFDFIAEFAHDIQHSLMSSLKVLFLVGISAYLVLVLWVLDFVIRLKHSLAIHLISMSTVLVGFSFYLVWPQSQSADYSKIPIAFTILFFPTLFKMFLEKKVTSFSKQILVAKLHGVSSWQITHEIVIAQLKGPIFSFFSLLIIWTLSDFAISKTLGVQLDTLGLFTENLLTSYRLESAYLMSFIILAIWFVLLIMLYLVMKGFNGTFKKR